MSSTVWFGVPEQSSVKKTSRYVGGWMVEGLDEGSMTCVMGGVADGVCPRGG